MENGKNPKRTRIWTKLLLECLKKVSKKKQTIVEMSYFDEWRCAYRCSSDEDSSDCEVES